MKNIFSKVFLVAFVALLGLSAAKSANAATEYTLFHESFGSVNSLTIPGWAEFGAASNSRIDTATPMAISSSTGYAFLGDNAGIATTSVSTLGYDDIKIYYYWRGSGNVHASSTDALKVYWKRSSDAVWTLANTHLSKGATAWSSQVKINLPFSTTNSSIDLKFVGATDWGVAGVSLDDVRITGRK